MGHPRPAWGAIAPLSAPPDGGEASWSLLLEEGEETVAWAQSTLYIPCIATVAVLSRELGWRRALLISGFTIALALLAGGIAHRLIALVAR